jgi:hypothetical protein
LTYTKESYDELKARYGDICLFHENQAQRKKAMDEVAVIFSTGVKSFYPGSSDVYRNYNTMDKQIIAHAAALRAEGPSKINKSCLISQSLLFLILTSLLLAKET